MSESAPEVVQHPLADALSAITDSQVPELVAGRPTDLLERVTSTTQRLVRYWFQEDYVESRPNNFHLGQRSAILNIIYAHEVLQCSTLRELYEELASKSLEDSHVLGEVARGRHAHPKYAAKMATGTGKTWVLNALLAWQFLNHRANPADTRFTSNFLLVAPGLIVYERLLDSFLGRLEAGRRNFNASDIYSNRDLFVPEPDRDTLFGFLQSSVLTKQEIGFRGTSSGVVAITNWHLLAGKEDPYFTDDIVESEDTDLQATASDLLPLLPGSTSGNALSALDKRFTRGRPLEWLRDLDSLMVFNDEAHHIHEVRRAEEVTDVEWQKSLSEIASTKGHRFVQVDFSATPYDEVGTGKNRRRQYFAHIVVDFDLVTAMRSGLVKALALDRRREIASLPLEFRADRDEANRVSSLSQGQQVMLRAGLKKLSILEDQFAKTDPANKPKLLIVCEDTAVTPFVESFLLSNGLAEEDVLRIDSGRKDALGEKEWQVVRERLDTVDRNPHPKAIISVLMLREGFDVNNICVVVPLRASKASILLEQTIGRGLRLMWRGDSAIDDLKAETRQRIASRLEPTNYFDVLFIVEHPAFADFYDDLINDGLAIDVGDTSDGTDARGDLLTVDLRDGFEAYDFEIPIVWRHAEEEPAPPQLDPMSLPRGKYNLSWLLNQLGKGDLFTSHDAQTGTQYGDYRVDGGVMTATGYNDYVSRMTNRVASALGRTLTGSASKYNEIAHYPVLQSFKPALADWIDTYIRKRLFSDDFDPFEGENWRLLLLDDVVHGIASAFATRLTELGAPTINQRPPEVTIRRISEVKSIPVRPSRSVEVRKCVYERLPLPPKGGLEKRFVQWADDDTRVEAIAKIHEYRHDFLRRPYLKADGMPGLYSPDFLVRTFDSIYVVETKAQSSLTEENVQRKKRAAQAWCDTINELGDEWTEGMTWYYVLIGESAVNEWKAKGARASELLHYARLSVESVSGQGQLL